MRITRIAVEKLFGVFDHNVELTKNNGITIIIGENGLGKTVILESINAFFGKNFKFFYELKFNQFSFHFDTREVWHLTKENKEGVITLYISKDDLTKPNNKIKPIKLAQELTSSNKNRHYRDIHFRDRELIDRMEYENLRAHELMSAQQLERHLWMQRRYIEHNRYGEIYDQKDITPPKWYLDGIQKVNIRLIETQRIITVKEIGGDAYVNTVSNCSNELKNIITKAVQEAADVTSSLDSSYPNRLIKKFKQSTQETFDQLNDELLKLDNRRKLLSSAGLVVDTQDSDLAKINEGQEGLIALLKLYIEDSYKKLDPYEDLSKKIQLFRGIVNKRFKHKTLEVNKDTGLTFRSKITKDDDGRFAEFPSSKLSSGEQHELVLFYKLIFNSKAGDMILIDEPELSLHISWQNKFIRDLKEVTSMNDVSIIIATHSPDIIDDNWDLRVELVGIE